MRFFLRDGPCCSAAGVTAGIDLALALVEEDYGRDVAMIVARYMVVFLKRPGKPVAVQRPSRRSHVRNKLIQRVQEYMLANLASPLHVDQIAQRFGMGPRNFARVFRREIDMTPRDFVTAARTDAARRLLEDTVRPLQRIASICGFQMWNALRRAFTKTIGVSPQQYRFCFHSLLGEKWRYVRQRRPHLPKS